MKLTAEQLQTIIAQVAANPEANAFVRERLATFNHNLAAVCQQPLPKFTSSLSRRLKSADLAEIQRYVDTCVTKRQAALVEFVVEEYSRSTLTIGYTIFQSRRSVEG